MEIAEEILLLLIVGRATLVPFCSFLCGNGVTRQLLNRAKYYIYKVNFAMKLRNIFRYRFTSGITLLKVLVAGLVKTFNFH